MARAADAKADIEAFANSLADMFGITREELEAHRRWDPVVAVAGDPAVGKSIAIRSSLAAKIGIRKIAQSLGVGVGTVMRIRDG